MINMKFRIVVMVWGEVSTFITGYKWADNILFLNLGDEYLLYDRTFT